MGAVMMAGGRTSSPAASWCSLCGGSQPRGEGRGQPLYRRADKGVAQGKGSGGLTWIIGSAACYGPSRRA
jgi:hypothetical protein